ncbi:hypothetical protein E2C01_056191 [Portunus trituberculatus]|uniref:Secreted protein n=1 Tax=Portunus trituberculatus TaxID=210409 RepID=A0A5B7GYY2_PORTR|nr:hypothetical protein [Portunus trituberculatus]
MMQQQRPPIASSRLILSLTYCYATTLLLCCPPHTRGKTGKAGESARNTISYTCLSHTGARHRTGSSCRLPARKRSRRSSWIACCALSPYCIFTVGEAGSL